MFSHVMLGSNNLDKAQEFYDALFVAIGDPEGMVDKKGRLVYSNAGLRFLITRPIDGEPATTANGSTIGFAVNSPQQVAAWHSAGIEHGGTSIESPPGERDAPMGRVYVAYLRDPDGHKLCAIHRYE